MLVAILAGGKGKRFKNPEKCIVSIQKLGKSTLELLLEKLNKHNTHVIVVTTEKHTGIISFCKRNSIDFIALSGLDLCYDMCLLVNIIRKRPLIVLPCDLVVNDEFIEKLLYIHNTFLCFRNENILISIKSRNDILCASIILCDRCHYGVEIPWIELYIKCQMFDVDYPDVVVG